LPLLLRKKRTDQRVVFRGAARDIEYLAVPTESFESAVEAEIDLDTILDETPPDLQFAMLMRLGARSSWKDVAKETSRSIDAIRMGCRREINRIRKIRNSRSHQVGMVRKVWSSGKGISEQFSKLRGR
jgi:DNA-directed RNA polymerase specialized sigma24 family protein